MKERRDPTSPFGINLWFDKGEIDQICLDALRDSDCLPSSPGPIEIETFIEKQFDCSVEYIDLGTEILGFTQFDQEGAVLRMGASSSLFEGGKSGARRARATLAHEAGHGVLHALLFMNPPRSDLFPHGMYDSNKRQIMCRDRDLNSSYKGRWWEYQANQAIGGFLLPVALVRSSVAEFLDSCGGFEHKRLVEQRREEAIAKVSEIFEVNPAAARIRITDLYPYPSGQMEF